MQTRRQSRPAYFFPRFLFLKKLQTLDLERGCALVFARLKTLEKFFRDNKKRSKVSALERSFYFDKRGVRRKVKLAGDDAP